MTNKLTTSIVQWIMIVGIVALGTTLLWGVMFLIAYVS